jgi:hypothetical protein
MRQIVGSHRGGKAGRKEKIPKLKQLFGILSEAVERTGHNLRALSIEIHHPRDPVDSLHNLTPHFFFPFPFFFGSSSGPWKI